MADVQIDNGNFTRIANALLEAIIRTKMSDYEHRIFWLIVRKTYGYNKKEDWIAQKQIVEETGILKQHVSRTIKRLREKNMVIVIDKKLAIQKDYDLWKLPEQVTNVINKSNPRGLLEVTSIGTKVTHIGVKSNLNRGTQKKKEIIQKKLKESPAYILSELLLNKIKENNPEYKNPNLSTWSTHIDKMIRIDKRKPDKIEEVIEWCQQDNFWYKNILSTEKLRKQYDQLVMNMGKTSKPNWRTT